MELAQSALANTGDNPLPFIVGGIVVVGSHTQKTTAQLEELLTLDCAEGIPFHSDLVLKGDEAFAAEIDRVVKKSDLPDLFSAIDMGSIWLMRALSGK